MNNIKSFTNIVEGGRRIKELFGVNPFTSKEYNEHRLPGSATINTLVDNHVVKIVHKEYFTKEIPSYFGKDYIVNQSGEIVMDADRYNELADYIRDALIKTNGGKPLAIVRKNIELVQCKRYYYALDLNGYDAFLSGHRMECLSAITRKRAEIEKLSKEILTLQTILN